MKLLKKLIQKDTQIDFER